ncbi:MAG TPA: hypothetical protein VMN38_09025 [Sphingomicrobium sp.]|nr:hypothetical protein [Sphingomicrobium sp.]
MRVRFEGAEAEGHRLEAYEGIKSLEGLIRVARIATHYSATGEVRFRAPYTDLLEMRMSQIANGSFEMIFDYASKIADHVQSMDATSKAAQLFQFLVRRGTGQIDAETVVIEGEEIPSGDIGAMSEAAESGLKSAHRWIGENGKSITVIDGEDDTTLNLETKEYVETELEGDVEIRDVSVAAINVNSRNGRVYLLDEHRTVPFIVHRDADPGTVPTLTRYLNKYANKTGETVSVRYRPVRHIDGRLKRIVIFDCEEIDEAA